MDESQGLSGAESGKSATGSLCKIHLFQLIERLLTRIGFDDAKVVAIFLFQVALELMQDLGEIINDNYCRSYHILLPISIHRPSSR